jgi:hypothetical protein
MVKGMERDKLRRGSAIAKGSHVYDTHLPDPNTAKPDVGWAGWQLLFSQLPVSPSHISIKMSVMNFKVLRMGVTENGCSFSASEVI